MTETKAKRERFSVAQLWAFIEANAEKNGRASLDDVKLAWRKNIAYRVKEWSRQQKSK